MHQGRDIEGQQRAKSCIKVRTIKEATRRTFAYLLESDLILRENAAKPVLDPPSISRSTLDTYISIYTSRNESQGHTPVQYSITERTRAGRSAQEQIVDLLSECLSRCITTQNGTSSCTSKTQNNGLSFGLATLDLASQELAVGK